MSDIAHAAAQLEGFLGDPSAAAAATIETM